jgi:homoserine kinase
VIVTASAPASVSNLGPGYDILGGCLSQPRDVVQVELNQTGVVELLEVMGDGGKLPLRPEENCATHVASEVLKRFGTPSMGLKLRLRKGLPLGSGLGSSAASGVAAALATAAALNLGITKDQLLDACREGERLATGSPHPDNVAPSLLGGLVACIPRGGESVEVVRLSIPANLHFVCVKPHFSVSTQMARELVPRSVAMEDCIENMGNLVGLVSALAASDFDLLGRCLTDRLATPHRAPLIHGYAEVTAAAREAGGIGAGISGSGPTLFAVTDSLDSGKKVREAMVRAFERVGHASLAFVSQVDQDGARIESNARAI